MDVYKRGSVGFFLKIITPLVIITLGTVPLLGQVKGKIQGRVFNVTSGKPEPLAGVPVVLKGKTYRVVLEAVSDNEGRYSFSNLKPGTYIISVKLPGFRSYTKKVRLLEGQTLTVNVELRLLFYEEEVTVTATRTERKTEEVPASITVISEEQIKETPMTNIKEILIGTPGVLIEAKNQGYDARLIIRGAGLKARYAVREIMVLLNGVPITDPDSLTRLDFIDTQLIERVEVVKGPNSTLWGINATGGVINVITKNPFETKGGSLRLGIGSYGSKQYQLSYANTLGEHFSFIVNASRRESDNSWRPWNEFDTTQITLQPSFVFSDGTIWQNFISYTKANLQLPGRLVVNPRYGIDQWTPYIEEGEVQVTAYPWRHSGRYSEIFFFSSKLNKKIGNFELKPLLYVNIWNHHHPVTGRINDADTKVFGIDFQVDYNHSFGTLTGGFTVRYDDQFTKYFTYAEVETLPTGRILYTLSDKPGELMEERTRRTFLAGVYLQESINFADRWSIDVGARLDRIVFDIEGTEWIDYSYRYGTYVPGAGDYESHREYTAFSPRIAVLYKLSKHLSLYGNISTGCQTPTRDEITQNPDLELTRVVNYEVGMKGRYRRWFFDAAVYYNPVKNEVILVSQPYGYNEFVNAGKTEKKGFEFAGYVSPFDTLRLGVSYSYTDYRFKEFSEPVFGRNVDRSGNYLPFIPRHQYSLFLHYRHPAGFKLRIQSNSWGEYYIDNANTEKYEGYRFVTDMTVGYETPKFDISLIVNNLFNQRYATEVKKNLYGVKTYVPAAPRTILLRLTYNF